MRRRVVSIGIGVVAVALLASGGLRAQADKVAKEALPGITNFARVETTVACAGATKPEAIADVKRLGFASVINLRLPTENGVELEAEAAAARAAGLRYLHLPFNSSAPDPAVVAAFLTAVTDPVNQPAFIHCASGNRASALWMIKRVQVDRWDIAKAGDEAAALGLTSGPLKQFVSDYLPAHPR